LTLDIIPDSVAKIWRELLNVRSVTTIYTGLRLPFRGNRGNASKISRVSQSTRIRNRSWGVDGRDRRGADR
jgi:hypothetical protein